MFLDGNSFVESPSVDKRFLVADLQAGVALTFNQLRLSYTQVWRTKEFSGQPAPEKFGAISASIRW
jgi:hypothetical protein